MGHIMLREAILNLSKRTPRLAYIKFRSTNDYLCIACDQPFDKYAAQLTKPYELDMCMCVSLRLSDQSLCHSYLDFKPASSIFL